VIGLARGDAGPFRNIQTERYWSWDYFLDFEEYPIFKPHHSTWYFDMGDGSQGTVRERDAVGRPYHVVTASRGDVLRTIEVQEPRGIPMLIAAVGVFGLVSRPLRRKSNADL